MTVNISNGWVGHLGTLRGDEYIDEKSHILYDFLNYCGGNNRFVGGAVWVDIGTVL